MNTDLLEQVFRVAFDIPLDPEDIPTDARDYGYGLEGYRERVNARRNTSAEERAYNERQDIEDVFGVCTAPVTIRRA